MKNQTANIRREQQGYLQNVLVLSVDYRLQIIARKKGNICEKTFKKKEKAKKKQRLEQGQQKKPSQRTSHVQNSTQTVTFSDIALHRDVVIDVNTGTRQWGIVRR